MSIRHRIIPIVGSNFSGSKDASFSWNMLDSNSPYEGIYLASPGIRVDQILNKSVGAIYQFGHLDCGMAIVVDTKFQRPALQIKSAILTSVNMQQTCRGLSSIIDFII